MKLGDLVVRKSYGGDITFRVETVQQDEAIIKGTDYRLIADSPLHDLVRVPESTIKRRTRQAHIKMLQSVEALEEKNKRQQAEISMADPVNSSAYFEMPGKVLHLDGDPNYLQKSGDLPAAARPAEGHYVSEANMADALYRLLPVVQPDIVVLTGHDGVLKQRKHRDLYNLQSYKIPRTSSMPFTLPDSSNATSI